MVGKTGTADQGSNDLINYYTKIFVLVALAFVLAACEVIVPKKFEVDEQEVLQLYGNVPLKDVMNNVQKKFQNAKNEGIFFYSPNNYKTARTGIQIARGNFRDPEKRLYVLKSLYKADKALDDAFEVKVIVESELADHIRLRDFLLSVDAKKTHTREYRSLMTSLTKIIERIEKEKEEVITNPEKKKDLDENKKEMMADLIDFRLRVVKFKYLNHGEQLLSEVDTYDGRSLAPETYARTISARDAAVKFITENVENLESVSDMSGKFQYEAQRLLHITRAIDTLMKLEKNNYEQYVLKQEENFSIIGDALREPNLKYLSFPAQARKYAATINRIIREKQENALKVAEFKSGERTSTDTSQETAQDVDQNTGQDQGDDKKGVEIVPIPPVGDPQQLRRSLKILTDQVYQLTVEKTAWENERATLQAQIKKLKEAKKTKPKAKPQAKPKKKEESKAKPKSEPKAEQKKEAAKKTEPEKEKAEAKPEADKTAGATPEEKPAEEKTAGEPAKSE